MSKQTLFTLSVTALTALLATSCNQLAQNATTAPVRLLIGEDLVIIETGESGSSSHGIRSRNVVAQDAPTENFVLPLGFAGGFNSTIAQSCYSEGGTPEPLIPIVISGPPPPEPPAPPPVISDVLTSDVETQNVTISQSAFGRLAVAPKAPVVFVPLPENEGGAADSADLLRRMISGPLSQIFCSWFPSLCSSLNFCAGALPIILPPTVPPPPAPVPPAPTPPPPTPTAKECAEGLRDGKKAFEICIGKKPYCERVPPLPGPHYPGACSNFELPFSSPAPLECAGLDPVLLAKIDSCFAEAEVDHKPAGCPAWTLKKGAGCLFRHDINSAGCKCFPWITDAPPAAP